MLTRDEGRLRASLAVSSALYAGSTLVVLTALQIFMLRPLSRMEIAVLLMPFVVCTTMTYVITRVIAQRRAKNVMEVARRFQRGELDDTFTYTVDPEFRESRELMVRLAQELQSATRQLAERDAERRRLFSDVVHELGTPISSLLGLAEALERPSLSATLEQRDRLSRAIARESERLAHFVEDLRDLAQLDDPAMALHKEPVALDELGRDVVTRLNAIPDTSEVRIEADAARVSADPVRVEQVFVNLLTNARRYAKAPAPIRVRVSTEDERALITVEDGGPGVADADLPKLGERMRRLDKSRTRNTGGTGLGLAIVTAIADKHGGRVRYRRSELGGLAVEVELPLDAAPSATGRA